MKYFKKAWAPTLIITVIFFVNYYFFGMENTLIGPFATLSYLRFKNLRHHYGCMLRTFLIYAVMALLAWAALMNLGLNILMNAAALFWIGNYIIDEYNPNNYFPAGMALIFFQIAPVDREGLLTRWLALLVSFFIIFLFLEISQSRKKACLLEEYIKEGLETSESLANAIKKAEPEEKEIHQQRLAELNYKISHEIYVENRAALKRRPDSNRYCRFLLCFQTVQSMGEKDNEKGIQSLIKRCREALESNSSKADIRRLKLRELKPDIRRFRFRFALRQVLVVTPCLAFAYRLNEYNGYWLAISVFFMMIPVYENTVVRIFQRIRGSIAGIIICMVLFTIFTSFSARVVLMTIFNFLIYSVNSYSFMVAYITGSALALNDLESAVSLMAMQRMGYTLIGAVIAYVANRYVFPIRIKNEMNYIKAIMEKIREQTGEIMVSGLNPDEISHHSNSILVKSYLLGERLETYASSLDDELETARTVVYIRNHLAFMAIRLMEEE